MNKNMVIVFFLMLIAAAGYYAYQQGCFDKGIDRVENALNEICDPSKEDCSEFQDDLSELA